MNARREGWSDNASNGQYCCEGDQPYFAHCLSSFILGTFCHGAPPRRSKQTPRQPTFVLPRRECTLGSEGGWSRRFGLMLPNCIKPVAIQCRNSRDLCERVTKSGTFLLGNSLSRIGISAVTVTLALKAETDRIRGNVEFSWSRCHSLQY